MNLQADRGTLGNSGMSAGCYYKGGGEDGAGWLRDKKAVGSRFSASLKSNGKKQNTTRIPRIVRIHELS